jgi:hypothetical protein
VEESKFDLSNVSMRSDYTLKQNSISKILDENAPDVFGSLLDTGSKYYKKLFGNNQLKKQLVFMQLLRHLSYIFDPWREESLPQICLRSS